MDEVRGQDVVGGRGPVLYRPEREMLAWMSITALTLGVIAGAMMDAHEAGDHGWVVLMGAMEFVGLMVYFYAALWWVNYCKI